MFTSKVKVCKLYFAFAFLFGALPPELEAALVHSVQRHDLGSRAVTNTSKAGLAWPNGGWDDVKQYQTTGKVSWYYTWSTWPGPSSTTLEFSPMLWGAKSTSEFTSVLGRVMKETKPSITAILGMNEPDIPTQSNLTAQEGATMWQTYLEPLRTTYSGVRLGSPATVTGKAWLQNFFTACEGKCTVDFVALHSYGIDASAFIATLWDYHYAFNKPLWITEWACQNYVDTAKQCSQEDVVNFLNETQTFMDGVDWVERYAWFGAMRDLQGVNPFDALMDKNGKITTLGAQYTGANFSQISGATPGITVSRGFAASTSRLLVATLMVLGSLQLVFQLL